MFIRIGFEISLECTVETPLLLALLPHSSYGGRVIGADRICTRPDVPVQEFLDEFGNRRSRLVAPVGRLTLWSDCIVENDGQPDVFNWNARQHDIADLPSETLTYLTASRYCEADELVEQAWALFGQTPAGWARVQAICNWVHNHLTFGYHFGRPTKTAGDALRERTGVCRDFAQLSVALCRAMNIPARYASGYLGDIGIAPSGPGDFCAWFEVFLEGRWYTFDARYNTPRIGRVLMVRGRDAADGAMITSFGKYDLKSFRVWTDEVVGMGSDSDMLKLLETRPDAPALTLAPT
ncbi:MAG: transglutaminase family protein [Alphaproteobacteria bacterium]|nr:transglutaminase family protein [Alphaproteobacteria bacterium]MBU0795787.1 transglutaminase family protein [Alphaproteobacteria bacterium]MBU0886649.1 transglutaminase family protein [Alphaproteobacteria bacterium]MBU1814504.1 transglutaminase family protein [Alphaproteobacteria bacterium]